LTVAATGLFTDRFQQERTMASAHVVTTTDAKFNQDVLQSDVPVLVDFWATWCGPCKAIAPHLDALADANVGKLKVVKLDVQTNPGTANSFGVTNIPLLLVFKGGKVVGKQVGAGGGAVAIQKLVAPHI
jgi:thioredoxin 1